jgi:hypothetical protein
MAVQTPFTGPLPPDLPAVPELSETFVNYLRTFSLWAKNSFTSKIDVSAAAPGLLLQGWDAPPGSIPNVYQLRVSNAGVLSLTPVALGKGGLGAPITGWPVLGLPVPPADGLLYSMKDGAWVVAVEEGPADGKVYGRKDAAWALSVEEAPSDDKFYSRKNAAWAPIVAGAVHNVRVFTTNATLNSAVAAGGELRFDTIEYDTDGFAPTGTFSTITIPAGLGGTYVINGWSSSSGTQATSMGMGLLHNGSAAYSETNKIITGPAAVNYTLDNAAVVILHLAAGDTLQLVNNSAAAGAFTATTFAITRIEPGLKFGP